MIKKYHTHINGMETEEDTINMIIDTIDQGDYESAKDYLKQYKEFIEMKDSLEYSDDKHQGRLDPDDWVADARDQHLINQNFNKATGGK
jgi:hypothetical protein